MVHTITRVLFGVFYGVVDTHHKITNHKGQTMSVKEEFKQRLAEAKAKLLANNSDTRLKSDIMINDSLKRETVKTLKSVILSVAEELNLDTEKFEKRIESARRSNYGRICELISIVASIYAWPISQNTQASEIPEIRERMLDKLAELGILVDGDLLLDMKEARGHNSFLDESTFEVVSGVEPIYDELQFYFLTFAELAQLPIIDYKMNETIWSKEETKAIQRIQAELEAAQVALRRKEEMKKALEEKDETVA